MDRRTCPHCGSEQIDARTGHPRTLGVEVAEVYDGVLFWQCPDCGGRWHRFDEGDPRHRAAEPYVNGQAGP